jgi:tetratricopeptide (TPR) repeat protein
LTCYSEALKYDQKRITLLNNTGLAYQNINNFDEAEKYFKKVLYF